MDRIYPLFLVFCFLGAALQAQEVKHDAGRFQEIKVYDGISANLIRSDRNEVVVRGENTRQVAVVNNDGILKIRMEITKIFSKSHSPMFPPLLSSFMMKITGHCIQVT